MSQQRPVAVTAATWLFAALIALTAASAVLALVFDDEIVDSWASGRVDAGTVEPPAIMPVAVVMLIVVALLSLVLLEFFRARHGWARSAITATIVLLGLSTVALLRIGPPPLFVALSVLSLILDAVTLVALWHRDTTAYLRGSEQSDEVSTRR